MAVDGRTEATARADTGKIVGPTRLSGESSFGSSADLVVMAR
jgi:hypothetical protein